MGKDGAVQAMYAHLDALDNDGQTAHPTFFLSLPRLQPGWEEKVEQIVKDQAAAIEKDPDWIDKAQRNAREGAAALSPEIRDAAERSGTADTVDQVVE